MKKKGALTERAFSFDAVSENQTDCCTTIA
jgi:hypothetical protein